MSGLRYLDLFVSESREHVGAAYRLLSELEQRPADRELHRELMRHAHSLKGMAATMGFGSMVDLAHALEDLFDDSLDPRPAPPLIDECLDCLGQMIDLAAQGQPAGDPRASSLASRLRENSGGPPALRLEAAEPQVTDGPIADDEGDRSEERFEIELRLGAGAASPAAPTITVLGRVAQLGRFERIEPARVESSTGRFDGEIRLVLLSGRPRAEIQRELSEQPDVEQVQVRPLPPAAPRVEEESQPVAWTRVRADLLDAVGEKTRDLVLEQGRARSATADLDEGLQKHLQRSEFLLRELHRTVTELRLVPFDTIAQRIQRVVGPLSRQLAKQAALRIEGRDVQLDRALLDALAEPLLHMVRNALDHGIELPSERRAAGKPPFGALELRLERKRDSIVVSLTDDGRGLRPDALKRSAIDRGLVEADALERMDETELGMLSTLPGVSTAERLSAVSGRGVGMDVVRSTAERLGGRLRISSEPGRGTSIRLTLPANSALIQVLLLRCDGELYALPISALESVVPLVEPPTEEPATLARRLGLPSAEPACRNHACAIALRRIDEPLVVDAVIGRRELLVRPLPPPLSGTGPFSGAALTDDGAIALLLDPDRLLESAGRRDRD